MAAIARLVKEAKSCVRQYVGGGSRLDEVEFLVVQYCWRPSLQCAMTVGSWHPGHATINRENGCIFSLISRNGIGIMSLCGQLRTRLVLTHPFEICRIQYHRQLKCLVAVDVGDQLLTIDASGRIQVVAYYSYRVRGANFAIDPRTGNVYVPAVSAVLVFDTAWLEIRRWSAPIVRSIEMGVHPDTRESILCVKQIASSVVFRLTLGGELLSSLGVSGGSPHPVLPVFWHFSGTETVFFDSKNKVVASDPHCSVGVDATDDGRTFLFTYSSDGLLVVRESSLDFA